MNASARRRNPRAFVEQIPDDEFVRVVDSQTKDEDCRSVQVLISSMVRAGYGYADYIREQLSIASTRPQTQTTLPPGIVRAT